MRTSRKIESVFFSFYERNTPVWCVFYMLHLSMELFLFVYEDDNNFTEQLLSPREQVKVISLMEPMKVLNLITVSLQDWKLDLPDVKNLFEKGCKNTPEWKSIGPEGKRYFTRQISSLLL